MEITNRTITRTSPLGIYITGTGEYVRDQVSHLVDYFDFIKFDHEQELKADAEQ